MFCAIGEVSASPCKYANGSGRSNERKTIMAKKLVLAPFVRDALMRVRKQQSVPNGTPMRLTQDASNAALRYALVEYVESDVSGEDVAVVLKRAFAELPAGFAGNASQFRQSCNSLAPEDPLWQPKTAAAGDYE